MEQVISIVVRNQPGVLMRVAGLFSRRGFNIDSLAVGITQNPEFSRMTVTMKADISTVDQVCKQLAKLVEVEAIKVLPPNASTKRSMALVKVKAGDKKLEILKLADVFRAHAIDVTGDSLTFLITGVNDKLHAFVDVMRPYGIIEMVTQTHADHPNTTTRQILCSPKWRTLGNAIIFSFNFGRSIRYYFCRGFHSCNFCRDHRSVYCTHSKSYGYFRLTCHVFLALRRSY